MRMKADRDSHEFALRGEVLLRTTSHLTVLNGDG